MRLLFQKQPRKLAAPDRPFRYKYESIPRPPDGQPLFDLPSLAGELELAHGHWIGGEKKDFDAAGRWRRLDGYRRPSEPSQRLFEAERLGVQEQDVRLAHAVHAVCETVAHVRESIIRESVEIGVAAERPIEDLAELETGERHRQPRGLRSIRYFIAYSMGFPLSTPIQPFLPARP
ncbi:MAG TPA: hypothetical protein VE093_31210 [Polyangiaceae bacterium]|nr:hypothetical protein [Polyangiaceae bacterium]